ncbi:uncharacterized protein BDZ99DRAFT_462052 [Mytilinidion resinicola]|uniref:DUF7907 domain-containing protein n=1 Tax=Mytilinidion resinicola TaxID=574789 RepID=A0A6A6YQA3_9PEZI|nr:uncharacterized protein BDZ99DRAFT_462052 [Mytilinidion resinicola]KAF2810708.1 hypothetical protein BDZ99DRAFT_462052 [Mytilinidion resinicola]
MKTSTTIIALAAATTTLAQYTNQSAPFKLQIKSENETLNGNYLYACHEGAAIEGLCPANAINLGSAGASTYNFNTSASTTSAVGVLTYLLQGSNFAVSEPFALSYTPSTNVAVPLFYPDTTYTEVGFDADNKLFIEAYVDDTVTPLKDGLDKAKDYYRWVVCETYAGYDYYTLAWVMGKAPAQNPSCQAVDVVREFVKA